MKAEAANVNFMIEVQGDRQLCYGTCPNSALLCSTLVNNTFNTHVNQGNQFLFMLPSDHYFYLMYCYTVKV
jgi:hypothetical protein